MTELETMQRAKMYLDKLASNIITADQNGSLPNVEVYGGQHA